MTTLQWLLLIGAITLVLGFYLYGRRLQDDDPWHGLDHEDDPDGHLDYDAPPPVASSYADPDAPTADEAPESDWNRESPRAVPSFVRQSVGDDREVQAPPDPSWADPAGHDLPYENPAAAGQPPETDFDRRTSPPPKQVPPPPADLRLRAEARPRKKSRWSFLSRTPPEPEQAGEAFDDYDDEPLTAEHLGRRQRIVDPSVADEFESEQEATGGDAEWLSASPARQRDEGFGKPPRRAEPVLGDESSQDEPAPAADRQLGLNIEAKRPAEARERPANVKAGQEKIVVLHVRAREGQRFEGPAVHSALQVCRLQFGMREIYHRITEVNGYPEVVFSVASMLKPGYLDPQQAQEFSTVGLTLFMVLPGPIDGVSAFRDLLNTADKLALRLGGEVLDETRTRITHQSAQYMRDEIAELERQWRVPTPSGKGR